MITRRSSTKKDHSKLVESIKYPLLNKLVSDQSKQLIEDKIHNQSFETNPNLFTYLVMKQKFDELYRRIERINYQQEEHLTRGENINSYSSQSNDQLFKMIHSYEKQSSPEICKVRTSLLQPKRYDPMPNVLEINTVTEGELSRNRYNNANAQVQLFKRIRNSKKLQPIKGRHMSDNIKDYLSVEKISMKEMQEVILSKAKQYKQYHLNQLLKNMEQDQIQDVPSLLKKPNTLVIKSEKPKESLLYKRNRKFKPPFELYYYRDFIWKIAFSNHLVFQLVQEYEQKIKFYVGKGNNSNLIKGIIKRRPWLQLTEKFQDAQVIWTQIKNAAIFSTQTKGEPIIKMTQQQRIIINQKTNDSKTSNQYKVLNKLEQHLWSQYWKKNIDKQRTMKHNMVGRSKIMNIVEISPQKRVNFKVHNHFCNNFIIGNKKALFKTMSQYYQSLNKDVFKYLPLTFHIKQGLEDSQYLKFLQHYYAIAKQNKNDTKSISKFNVWIVKPGQNTNRGNGIIVCLDLNEIKNILKTKERHGDGTPKTYILQKYIQRPLLYKKRKFDLRHYIMINCCNGRIKGYWYRQGYVRTTSTEYTLKASNGAIHLTNDAVQKYLPDYGRYEKGNKITYEDLDAYMRKQDANFDFFSLIYPKMKQVATDAIKASAFNIDPMRRVNNFQIFGMDFMIDENYNVWLIEINTNPCLETTCPVLNKIIPRFIENTFQICLDPLFPPPLNFVPKLQLFLANVNDYNNFDLVFDESIDVALSIGQSALISPQQDEDQFDDDGQDFNED